MRRTSAGKTQTGRTGTGARPTPVKRAKAKDEEDSDAGSVEVEPAKVYREPGLPDSEPGWILPGRGLRAFLRLPPKPVGKTTPPQRFHYVLNVLASVLELPVDRQDLLTPPKDRYFKEYHFNSIVPLDARRAMYNYLLHNMGYVERALDLWLGSAHLDSLKLMLMRQKIAVTGVAGLDFSLYARSGVPVEGDRWRGDGPIVAALVREMSGFKEMQFNRALHVARLQVEDPRELQNRQLRIISLQRQLRTMMLLAKQMNLTGPEPTQLTWNRLIENGDEVDPMANWVGLSPKTTLERWDSGVRRLKMECALLEICINPWLVVRDEVPLNKMIVHIELGHAEPRTTARVIQDAIAKGHTQWTRKKRRTDRWAFNFDYPDPHPLAPPCSVSPEEAEKNANPEPRPVPPVQSVRRRRK